jgi:hypothetical protein
MSIDPETFSLFQESNFDTYDSGSDRYSAVLRAGVEQHGLELSDVLAVTQDFGLWAICTTGVFHGSLRGVFKKRIEIDPLIPYSRVSAIREEPSGPHTMRIVLTGGDGKELARMDFSAGGMENTPQLAAGYRAHVYRVLQQQAGGH